jgi:hypothetical protein
MAREKAGYRFTRRASVVGAGASGLAAATPLAALGPRACDGTFISRLPVVPVPMPYQSRRCPC